MVLDILGQQEQEQQIKVIMVAPLVGQAGVQGQRVQVFQRSREGLGYLLALLAAQFSVEVVVEDLEMDLVGAQVVMEVVVMDLQPEEQQEQQIRGAVEEQQVKIIQVLPEVTGELVL